MKRVVLTSTPDSTYDFFLPIATRAWRAIGYEPIVFVVGSRKEWASGHRAVALDEAQAPVRYLPRIPGVPDSNVAMSIRQHVCALESIDENDLVLVGDVDLLPLSKPFYHLHDPKTSPVTVYFAGTNRGYWPAYGPSMTARLWREVMDLEVGDPIGSMLRTWETGGLQRMLDARRDDPTNNDLWTFDETDASERIRKCRLGRSVEEILVHKSKRLCRHEWPETLDLPGYIDFHCPRPGWTPEHWEKIREVLAWKLPEERLWMDFYIAFYRSTCPVYDSPLA